MCLVIIDMQPKFKAALDATTQQNIIAQIEKAKANDELIVVVEYGDCGLTLEIIRKAIGFYEQHLEIIKWENDGSRYIQEVLDAGDIYPDHFKITGVNLHACVAETAMGLADKYRRAKVTIIPEACNGLTANSFFGGGKLEKVTVDWTWKFIKRVFTGKNLEIKGVAA